MREIRPAIVDIDRLWSARTPSASLWLIFVGGARHDRRVLEMILLIVRALALACRGHRELVLENMALRRKRPTNAVFP